MSHSSVRTYQTRILDGFEEPLSAYASLMRNGKTIGNKVEALKFSSLDPKMKLLAIKVVQRLLIKMIPFTYASGSQMH